MRHWLFKSEPESFGIDTLSKMPKQTEHWDGVRNYQARNMMRDDMQKGDLGFFYHSNCTPPGIAGVVEIVKASYPDFTAFDPESKYYDPKSTAENPRWFMVDVKLVKKFSHFITLEEIRQHPKLESMMINRRGNRLSITPVTAEEWKVLMKLGDI